MANRWLRSLAALVAVQIFCIEPVHAQETAAPYQATQSPAPASGYVVVTAPEADVLADPRTGAAAVLKGFKGDLFPLRGQQGEWFLVATGESATGWLRRGTAALLMYPEFLDPVRLRESYTQPPYVPPSAYGNPGWGYRRIPYPWQDPLWWGLWYYDQKHDDDDDDDHHHGHDDQDGHRGRGGRDDHGDRDRDDRGRRDRGGDSRPIPQRDPRQR